MKNRLIIVIVLLLSLNSAIFSQKTAVVISENANLRGTPSENGKLVTILSVRENLEFIEQKGAWFLVQSNDYFGWIHGNSIKLIVKDAKIILENLSSEESTCSGGYKLDIPVVGQIIKRSFDKDAVTLIGVTVKEKNDDRYYINIDYEYLREKGRHSLQEVANALGQKQNVKIYVYACGASGSTLYVDSIKAQ